MNNDIVPSTRTFVRAAKIELLPLDLFVPVLTTPKLREYQEQAARHEVMSAVNSWYYAAEEEPCPPTLRSAT